MGSHGNHIAFAFSLSLLSISFIILIIILVLLCRKKPKECTHFCLDTKTSVKNFSLMEIDSSTQGFNPKGIIGKGNVGTTYVGVLEDGKLVVVKRIHPRLVLTKPGLGFQSMIKSISQAQHPNIVPIVGLCEAPSERIILTEFVGTKTLEFYLHQSVDGPTILDWAERLRIASGLARGLEYLHEKMATQVVHGCIKPTNIWVDVKLNARICDYGLSLLGSKQERVGLVGYVDEEYWVFGGCKESDMYGFGVVLLELLSGRKNEGGLLVKWVLPLIKEMRYSELLDPRLVMPSNLKPIVRLGKVALACVGNSRKTRPKISQVVGILDNLDTNLCDI